MFPLLLTKLDCISIDLLFDDWTYCKGFCRMSSELDSDIVSAFNTVDRLSALSFYKWSLEFVITLLVVSIPKYCSIGLTISSRILFSIINSIIFHLPEAGLYPWPQHSSHLSVENLGWVPAPIHSKQGTPLAKALWIGPAYKLLDSF